MDNSNINNNNQNSDNTQYIIGCHDEGANAYWDDKSLGTNPYPEGTIKHQCWKEGWEEARKEVEGH